MGSCCRALRSPALHPPRNTIQLRRERQPALGRALEPTARKRDQRSYCLQKFMRGLAMYSSSDIRTTHLLLHKVDQVRGKHVCAVHTVDTIDLLGHERGCLRCARGSHVSCCNTHSVGVPRSHTAHKEHRRTYCSVGRHFLRLFSCQIPCILSTVCLPQHCGHYSVHYLYVWHDDLILSHCGTCILENEHCFRSARSSLI